MSKLSLVVVSCMAVALLVLTAQETEAIACTYKFCDNAKCQNNVEMEKCAADSMAVYKEKGGMCGCCGLCVKQLSKFTS